MGVKLDVSHSRGRTQTEGVREQGARRMFGPKREEVVGGWRRLHDKELHNLYGSPDIVKGMKSGRMRLEGVRREET
jgi:hypothetical protein